jgi:hypothetical protein
LFQGVANLAEPGSPMDVLVAAESHLTEASPLRSPVGLTGRLSGDPDPRFFRKVPALSLLPPHPSSLTSPAAGDGASFSPTSPAVPPGPTHRGDLGESLAAAASGHGVDEVA